MGLPRDTLLALVLFERAAALGHSKSAYRAANILNGLLVVDAAPPTGEREHRGSIDGEEEASRVRRTFSLYKQAALAGWPEAMNALALFLQAIQHTGGLPALADGLTGRGALCEACRLFFTAFEMGLEAAACNLALLLAKEPVLLHQVDDLVGLDRVKAHVVGFLEDSVRRQHPLSHLFASALERLALVVNGEY